MEKDTLKSYIRTIEGQREVLYHRLEGISREELWKQPSEGKWSIGENLLEKL